MSNYFNVGFKLGYAIINVGKPMEEERIRHIAKILNYGGLPVNNLPDDIIRYSTNCSKSKVEDERITMALRAAEAQGLIARV